MKDLFLIPVMIAIVVLGYYAVKITYSFAKQKQRWRHTANSNGHSCVKIGAENSAMFRCIEAAVKKCSGVKPHIVTTFTNGKKDIMLEKILKEQLDLVLLTQKNDVEQDGRYAFMPIPCVADTSKKKPQDSAAENADSSAEIYLVWKRNKKSRNRDSVIFALENEQYRLKSGYADYL